MRPVRVQVEVDLPHGGRWTSLRAGRREWLWRNERVPAPVREAASPGQPFVDAGGVEECFPCLRGPTDHGEVWARPWAGSAADAAVTCGELAVRRRFTRDGEELVVDYEITGPPGAGVLHAVHGLYDLSPAARLVVSAGAPVVVLDQPAPEDLTCTLWPDGAGVRLDTAGPLDGQARCAVVDTDAVEVVDGEHRLRLAWERVRGTGPVSLVVWRNLGGWPDGSPYRSFGIEPLLGAATDLDRAAPGELARLDADGRLDWRLRVSAWSDT